MDVRVGLWRKLSSEELMLLNCGVGEGSWESLGLQGDPTSPFWRRSALGFLCWEWCWSWNSSTLATSCEELTHRKRLWCWEELGAGGEGDDRGWDGWMASLTRWMWVWVNSGRRWWTGRPGVLRFMGSQRVEHDWPTEMNWTDCHKIFLAAYHCIESCRYLKCNLWFGYDKGDCSTFLSLLKHWCPKVYPSIPWSRPQFCHENQWEVRKRGWLVLICPSASWINFFARSFLNYCCRFTELLWWSYSLHIPYIQHPLLTSLH